MVTYSFCLPGGNCNNNGNFNNIGENGYWWSSSENNTNNAWKRNLNYNNSKVNRNNNNKNNGYSVRCIRDLMGAALGKKSPSAIFLGEIMQYEMFNEPDYTLLCEELFEAYYDCRKNKRNTIDSLQFEKQLEKNLFSLINEVFEHRYFPQPSRVFIVNKPVKREIFAATFRDRIVHHWLIRKLNPLFEQLFIENSFACRKGKGTHLGVRKVAEAIRNESNNFTEQCYVMKLDIQGFFMHINRVVLYESLHRFIEANYIGKDRELIVELLLKIVLNNPAEHCIIKGSRKEWLGLPNDKSLFYSPLNCGLPIGNLTSQVFANFYLHSFDTWMNRKLENTCYFRYVDDFVIVHKSKDVLLDLLAEIKKYLRHYLHLTLHPHKIYLQHVSKGVHFLGTIIKPQRLYVGKRMKGNVYAAINKLNTEFKCLHGNHQFQQHYLSVVNSYLGLMKHFNSYHFRKKIDNDLVNHQWKSIAFIDENYLKYSFR